MTWGRGIVFQPTLFLFKPDFDHGMKTCNDMFDMFSSTCLSCDPHPSGSGRNTRHWVVQPPKYFPQRVSYIDINFFVKTVLATYYNSFA